MPVNPKTLLVVNPSAGRGQGEKVFRRLRPRLVTAFPNLDVRVSEYAGQAVEHGLHALEEGFRRIIVIGGDGTPFEVLNGLWSGGPPREEIDLACIPAGTGNSFHRDFGPVDPDRSLDNIIAGRRLHVDVVEALFDWDGQAKRRYFLNILGAGLIADILQLTNEKLKFMGSSGYGAAVLVRLLGGIRNRMRLTVDGETHELRDSALVVSNTRFTGGAMQIAPLANPRDGRADVVAFVGVGRRDMVRILAGVYSGQHVLHPKVRRWSGAAMRLEADPPVRLMADGELLGRTPLTLRVFPQAQTVML